MAGAAAPILEGAIVALLKALGFAGTAVGAAGAANELAKKRAEAADNSKNSPLAQAGTQAKAAEKEKCKKCPADEGGTALQSTSGWNPWTIEYQMRIAQMPPAPAGYLTEWMLNGVKFDGFDSGQCLLKEAKARYDQFFDDWGGFRYDFQAGIFVDMMNEAIRQNFASIPKPPISLRWHFMEPISYRYMQKILRDATPQIEVIFQPA